MLVAQALLELTAKLVQLANYMAFCENALAHSILVCWRKLDARKENLSVLPDSTSLSKSGCPKLLLTTVKPCSQQVSEVNTQSWSMLYSKRYSSKLAATVTLVYNGILRHCKPHCRQECVVAACGVFC